MANMMTGPSSQGATGSQGMSSLLQAYAFYTIIYYGLPYTIWQAIL